MSSIAKVALSVFLSGAAGACTQTTPIQEFLDPTPVATTAPNPAVTEQADLRTAGEIAVQKTGDRIFLVPGASASQEPLTPVPN